MQNDPEMELGLWDGNQEVHLQLLRHVWKTSSSIKPGEKNFNHPCQGGRRMKQENIWVLAMAPIFTSCESLGKLGNLSLFITSKMEKIIIIFTLHTTLRNKGDNDYVKHPAFKHLWQPNNFHLWKKEKEMWLKKSRAYNMEMRWMKSLLIEYYIVLAKGKIRRINRHFNQGRGSNVCILNINIISINTVSFPLL